MRPARLLAVLIAVTTMLGLAQGTAAAAGTTPSALELEAPATAPAGSTATLTSTLTDPGAGTPIAGATVVFEHQVGGDWAPVGQATTDGQGRVARQVPVAATEAENVYRTTWAGDDTYAPATSPEIRITPATESATLAASAPEDGFVREEVPFRVRLQQPGGAPIAGAAVTVHRRVGGEWGQVATVTTDAEGRASTPVTVRSRAGDNVFRAEYAGPPVVQSAVVRVTPELRPTKLTVKGPASLVDETTATLTVRWEATNGAPVPARVKLMKRERGKWSTYRKSLRIGADGVATIEVRPRYDSRWKAVGKAGSWYRGDTSNIKRLDNVPPHDPVVLPAAAPKPRIKLPAQARAVGAGPNAKVSKIPNGVWKTMVGRSWHQGCPVGRAGLRLVRINYWGYDGYRHRGELVVASGAAGKAVKGFSAMYRGGYPIRAMYRVDRFGWSKELQGANDRKSMSAGNTSAFNCRSVVGKPGVRSPHSYGRAIDINTWENPYKSRTGIVPNKWWQRHSHPLVAWRSRSHAVVKLLAKAGLRWTYGLGDTQHFDA